MADRSKAVGYIRVNSESAYKLAVQKKDIIEHCHRHNIYLHNIYEDIGASHILERQGLSEALEAIKNGDAAVLITSKVSRISRKISDVLTVVKILEDSNATYIAVKEGIDTSTEEGKHFLHTGAIFSKMDEDHI